jgi:aspartate aminotransferase/aromatic-amino-acid transaminase
MAHFDLLEMAPPDPILGLTDAFKKDTHPDKINLGVGVFVDDNGKTPVLQSVKKAEERLLTEELSKTYLPITGSDRYAQLVNELVFGDQYASLKSRLCAAQTPGGTGALRVAAEVLSKHLPGRTIWMSNPTWANHGAVFQTAGLKTTNYRYFDAAKNGLDFEGMMADLHNAADGDFVLLHGCCHNPSGIDPDQNQWQQIGELLRKKNMLPLIDFAYQGFGAGIEEDAAGIRILASIVDTLIVASSYSKNFGLYNERTGALSFLSATPEISEKLLSQLKVCIRTNYSNPPAHGGLIVSTILGDAALKALWESEVTAMRSRINGVRNQFVDQLKAIGIERDFNFIRSQKGMFSFSGLTKAQVDILREKDHIYMVSSGRINVAGITQNNIDRLCRAIAAVM